MSEEKVREFEQQAEKATGMALDICQERSTQLRGAKERGLPLGFRALCALAMTMEHATKAFVLLARSLFRP